MVDWFGEEEEPPNPGTAYRAPQGHDGRVHLPFDAQRLFVERYAVIKEALERHQRKTGVLLMAFDDRSALIGEGWLEASLDRSRAAIIGRHSECGLALPQAFQELPLRHLALIVRAVAHDEVRLRIMDLHTGVGFGDEAGRTLQAVTSDGPVFLSLGRVRLAILVTGDETELPEDPNAAYRWIPERVFIEERGGAFVGLEARSVPRVRARAHEQGHGAGDVTRVRAEPGAISDVMRLCTDDELPVAKLTVFGLGMSSQRAVGGTALARGILLGRYSRCDIHTERTSMMVSRVHLLLVRHGDEVLAIDAGSTNGTYKDGKEYALLRLTAGDVLDLGNAGHLRVLWECPD